MCKHFGFYVWTSSFATMDSSIADTVFFGGNIITMDEANPKAEALAVQGEKIVKVGQLDDVFCHVGPNTKIIYLNKQTLLPGFIEPHQHAIQMVLQRCMYYNIGAYYFDSYDEIKKFINEKVSDVATASPIEWCVFIGWDPELISDLPRLSADFMDKEFLPPVVPVVIVGQSLHVAWANHAAMEAAEIPADIEDPTGGVFGRDENGVLTGQMFEAPAMMRVLSYFSPAPDKESLLKAVKDQWQDYASRGFTTVTDMSYVPMDGIDVLLSAVASQDECPVRLALYTIIYPEEESDGRRTSKPKPPLCCPCLAVVKLTKKSAGTSVSLTRSVNESSKLWEAGVKIVADGSPHTGTMADKEPFLYTNLTEVLGFPKAPCYGQQNFSNEELYEMVKKHHCEGKQISIHAHGDRTCDQAVSAYEKVLAEFPRPDSRHRMEHLGLMTAEQIARAASLDLALSFFVCHLYYYGKTYSESIFGRERTNRWAPVALASKEGMRWTIHQDHPAFPQPPLPFANLKTAVTRTQRDDNETVYGPEYCVNIHNAIKGYTINAAWQIHRDDKLGSLTANKMADLLILDQNPYEVDPMKLEEIKVVETFLGGRRTNLAVLKTLPNTNIQVLSPTGNDPQ